MKIWIDADAAPNDVKQIVFRAAKRLSIETILVANRSVSTPSDAPFIRSIVVSEGADQADRYIVRTSDKGDLAITADLPLAALLVEQGVRVIDPRGETFTRDNIAARLSMRNFMDELRGSGVETGGAPPYGDKDKKAFASAFDRNLTKLTRDTST